MANIVLAHGICGFGNILGFRNGFYFNSVAKLYRSKGHDVLEPTVDMLGSLQTRSDQLEAAIKAKWRDNEPIHIIAHSMGGLDARRVIKTNHAIGQRVKTLITIATPHLGSPVANARGLRLFVRGWVVSFFKWLAPATEDLQTRAILQNADRLSVKYITIACDRTLAAPGSLVFALTRCVGGLPREANDGVVEFSSASPGHNPPDLIWPVDHGGAIGWPSGYGFLALIPAVVKPPADHLARYKKLLNLLVKCS
jgi:triacylglycerol lipase